MLHVASHCKIFYWLNISELSVIKNVTANYLETSYILFFTTLQYTKNALITGAKINQIFENIQVCFLFVVF